MSLFETVGAFMSVGRSPCAWSTAFCTSSRAICTSLPTWNETEIETEPSVIVVVTPSSMSRPVS